MKKRRSILCFLCLVLLTPLFLHARRVLPVDTHPLVAEKYAGWSGVLRMWMFEGWPCGAGSISPWLNHCIARFERSHPGVYIQPRAVDAGAIASINESGILPPDMILFPPGLLEAPTGLLPIPLPAGLRPSVSKCGNLSGRTCAIPVAMGGYLWVWNAALTDGIPGDWRNSALTLAVPAPEAWRHWDAALLALCAGRPAAPSEGEITSVPELMNDLDLGLSGMVTPMPTDAPPSDDRPLQPVRLPESFQYSESAWHSFTNGEAAATIVTQREIRRLQALAEQGKGPDWRLAPGDAAFTDQLLALALVDRPDAAEQQALCREFLSFLLTDDCQRALYLAGAFSVTGVDSGYGAGDPLATLDTALHDNALRVPNCFDTRWPGAAENNLRELVSEGSDSTVLWQKFTELLSE